MTIIDQAAHTIMETDNRIKGHLDGITFLRALAYAKALQDAGLLAPDLPKPDIMEFEVPIWTGVFTSKAGADWAEVTGGVMVYAGAIDIVGEDTYSHTPDEARRLALALLAAANHAEEQKS